MDTFEIIDTMLARPYLFTGGESLSALRYFLGGYNFCRMEKGEFDGSEARFSLLPLDWQLFTDLVRNSLPREFTEGREGEWSTLLMDYYGDGEGYSMFRHFYENFRHTVIRGYKRLIPDEEQLAHYRERCKFVMDTTTEEERSTGAFISFYEQPEAVYLAELSCGGWVLAVEDKDEVAQKCAIFRTEDDAEAMVQSYFGKELSWFGVTGVEELSFRKPVRLEQRLR